MDENMIQAKREALILPALRDGAFVTEWQNAEVKFSSGRGSFTAETICQQ
jgi:hypothetical protein